MSNNAEKPKRQRRDTFQEFIELDIDALFEDAAAKAVKKFTTAVVKSAKKNAPEDSGKLKKSIRKVKSNDPLEQALGSKLDYAATVENGSRTQNASHFLQNAVDKEKDQMVEYIGKNFINTAKRKKKTVDKGTE